MGRGSGEVGSRDWEERRKGKLKLGCDDDDDDDDEEGETEVGM